MEIPQAISQYFPYIPLAAFAFMITFIFSPLLGKFAQRFGFMDYPSIMRGRGDHTKDRRVHDRATPRLGGLAIVAGFFLTIAIFDNVPSEITGILIGMGIITLNGILDDKYELSGKTQILFQLIAASIVIISGVTIKSINIAGIEQDFASFSEDISLFGFTYHLLFPADLITLCWILLVMNALAWVCGIDALGESMTFIASVTLGAMSMKLGNPGYTMIFFVFAGATMGFIPFNFPKAKMFGGTVGHLNYGFFLATMTVQSETKLASAVMILILPLIDMFWVLFNRLRHNKLDSIFDLLSISDRTHFHHRIMDLGFNVKETLYLELVIFSIFCLGAFYLGGFSFDFIVLASGLVLILLIFTLIGILYKNNWSKRSKSPRVPKKTVEKGTSPEERYAY